jgi:FKBP-type peptidyl-prolyl cis-trans isomerase FkpA
MRKLIFLIPVLALFGCGEEKPVEEVVVLETFEDRLSYALGAMNGKAFMESPDPNVDRLDKEMVIKGFAMNFSSSEINDCEQTLMKLYGPYGTDFDTIHLKAGSECRGREIGYYFYQDLAKFGKIKMIKKDKMKKGFEHALYGKDTIVSLMDQQKLITEFYTSLMNESADKMFAGARKKSNVKELEGGILLETIVAGKGGSPSEADDVKADYILLASTGDTIQNSFMRLKMPEVQDAPAFNLSQVFMGWTKSFPHMKKGGKYKIYLPWEMIQDQRLQNQSVCFYIDFIDYGPAFTLAAKPEPQVGM